VERAEELELEFDELVKLKFRKLSKKPLCVILARIPVDGSRIVEIAYSGDNGSSVSAVVGNSRSVITGICGSLLVEEEGRWACTSRCGIYDVGMFTRDRR
jgi:hypothetical protein